MVARTIVVHKRPEVERPANFPPSGVVPHALGDGRVVEEAGKHEKGEGMSLLGKGHRGRRTALIAAGALFAFQALAVVAPQTASAAIVSCSFGGGTLTVNMTGTEAFSTDASGNITLNGSVTDPTCTSIPATKATLTNTTAIVVNGAAGNETVSINLLVNWGKINWTVDLSTGTDTVTLDGSAATVSTDLDTVAGASGIDLNDDGDLDVTLAGVELIKMLGGAGDDFLCGGGSTITGGPTTIAMSLNGGGGTGYDDLCGGLGNDTITAGTGGSAADYLNFTGPITADLGAGTVTGAGSDTLVGITDIYGSKGNDTITGSIDANDIAGGPGDDKIDGLAGEDIADFFDSAVAVTVDLGAGTATGDGNDTLKNMEDVFGSDFNDVIAGAPHVDNVLDGSDGLDWVDYSSYSTDVKVVLDGTTCSGHVSNECDLLVHDESAMLGSGDDTFTGNAFNNVVQPGGGQNALDGLGGGDTLDYSEYEAGATVNLAGGGTVGDSAVNFENVTGTAFADNFTGNEVSNTILGQGGEDTIRGGGGDDTLKGAKGNDTIRGGAGDDDMFGGKGKHDAGYGGGGTDLCKGFEIRKGCELH